MRALILESFTPATGTTKIKSAILIPNVRAVATSDLLTSTSQTQRDLALALKLRTAPLAHISIKKKMIKCILVSGIEDSVKRGGLHAKRIRGRRPYMHQTHAL
jgi:hypothetical protein